MALITLASAKHNSLISKRTNSGSYFKSSTLGFYNLYVSVILSIELISLFITFIKSSGENYTLIIWFVQNSVYTEVGFNYI